MPGISATIAPTTISVEKMPRKIGASRKLCDKPFSKPNASLNEYAVASGKTPIANIAAPNSPMPNRYLA